MVASLLLTPLVRRIALQLDLVDRPDAQRKLHTRAIPLGGGIAVFLAFTLSLVTVVAVSISQRLDLVENSRFLVAIVAAGMMICALGILDDRFNLRGRHKLVGQCVAASLLIVSGVWIDRIQVFGITLDLGLLAVPFTLFWLLGAVNSLNLI
ncbi:MAG: undecaprenyl/decaprenyl-phosphate alpha-N-acetylglucosaminyl 1-phosphate transferase, partial [Pirellulales bacterium]